MHDEKVVGLGRVVIARRERIMMLEPLGKGILGTALRYGSEVRGEEAYFEDIPELKLPQQMKDLAHVIIERKAGHFKPEEFTDRYEDAVVELIRAKQAGMPAKVTEQPTRPTNVVSIMDALRKSIAVEAAKSAGAKPKAEPGSTRTSPPPSRRLRRRRRARLRPPLRPRPRRRYAKPSEAKSGVPYWCEAEGRRRSYGEDVLAMTSLHSGCFLYWVSIYTRKRDSNCFAENVPLKLGLAGWSVSIWVPIVERRQAKSTSSECGFSGLNRESFGSTKR